MPHQADVSTDIAEKLRRHGISPTAQRIAITQLLFNQCAHLSADDVYRIANETNGWRVSKGVIREVIADPDRIFYDPNASPHHHFYDVETGRLSDIDASQVVIQGLPALPPDAELEGVDVIVRLRSAKQQTLGQQRRRALYFDPPIMSGMPV